MTHLLQADPALEELRRQLRDGEITYQGYKQALRTLPEPPTTLCDMPGCNREAHTIERGQRVCAACGLKARSARQGR